MNKNDLKDALQTIDELKSYLLKLRSSCEELGLKVLANKLHYCSDQLNFIKSRLRED